jgi:hypothetical protein
MSTKDGQNQSKINRLLKVWPKGTAAVHEWLEEQGVYRQLVESYLKTSWLVRIGRGAFSRADDKVDWTGGLYALQKQMGLSVHAGGKTALQMLGYGHFLPVGKERTVVLFGIKNEKLPSWFREHEWKVNLRYTMTSLFGNEKQMGLTGHTVGEFSVKISSPERAMMELCYDVPDKESFQESELLMEGLATLRPNLVQELLEKCRSVKVKRLFMCLAERQKHAWAKRLHLSKVDFGQGKRSLYKEGEYDSKYQLVIPKKETNA